MEPLFETVSQNELFFFKMLLVMAFHHSNRAVQNPPFNSDKSLHTWGHHSKLGMVTHICNLSTMEVEAGELRVQVSLGPMKCYLQGKGTLSLYTSMSVCNYYMTTEKANIVIIKKKKTSTGEE